MHEFRAAFPAGEMWRVCLQICQPPGVWWATRVCSLGPPREWGKQREGEGEQLPSYYNSWKDDGRARRHSSRRICMCQATAPGALMVLRYFSSPTFYFQLLRLWAGLRCWHHFISPTNRAIKRVEYWTVTVEVWVLACWYSWMNSETLGWRFGWFLLDAVVLNAVQSAGKVWVSY